MLQQKSNTCAMDLYAIKLKLIAFAFFTLVGLAYVLSSGYASSSFFENDSSMLLSNATSLAPKTTHVLSSGYASSSFFGNDSSNATSSSPQTQALLPKASSSALQTPLILGYTKFYGKSLVDRTVHSMKECPFQCRFSADQELYPEADVALFHARDFWMDEMLYKNRRPERLNLFIAWESAPNEVLASNVPKNFFNISMTFRRDSTIWVPYGNLESIQPNDTADVVWNDEQIDKVIEKKHKLALQFVSNCGTSSKREKYLSALQRKINVTVYGKCNNNLLPKIGNRMERELEKHYFYLAFENSVCEDYITEKFWRFKNLIVPIVLKRSIMKGIIEDEYFIAADDFKSPDELAERMQNLTQNLQEYKKYFGWTKMYRKTIRYIWEDYCRVCEMATKKEKHSIKDIYQWWQNEAKCFPRFAQNLLRNL